MSGETEKHFVYRELLMLYFRLVPSSRHEGSVVS